MRMRLLPFLLVATVFGGACTSAPTLPSATIATMSITGTGPGVGTSAQFSASIIPASGSSAQDVTGLATWSVADPTVATVSRGLVAGVKAGSTKLTATYGGSTVTAQITIHS
jgi:hypothetical protein